MHVFWIMSAKLCYIHASQMQKWNQTLNYYLPRKNLRRDVLSYRYLSTVQVSMTYDLSTVFRKVLAICGQFDDKVLTICWWGFHQFVLCFSSEKVLRIFWQYHDNLMTICWESVDNLWTVWWQNDDSLLMRKK